jgi:BirA family biotin operon repressor/biotin-[acetyl-CoA-carboxylase] ligase
MFMQIGQKIIRLDSVDSTNNYAANLQKGDGIGHGTVILADEQTAGRGQRGAVWDSKPAENLLVSVFLTPANLSVHDQVALTHFASLSVVQVLRKFGISSNIKWPNDVLVDGKKIAGILIENTISSGRISASIIGIGLNVNQTDFNGLIATSVRNCFGSFVPLEEVLFSLIAEMARLWPVLEAGDRSYLRNEYLEQLYMKNKQALFSDAAGEFVGMITGITEDGQLIVKRKEGDRIYGIKEIRFISQSEP